MKLIDVQGRSTLVGGDAVHSGIVVVQPNFRNGVGSRRSRSVNSSAEARSLSRRRTTNSHESGIDSRELRASEAENVAEDSTSKVCRLRPCGPVASFPFMSGPERNPISCDSDRPRIAAITTTLANRKDDGGLVLVGIELDFETARVPCLVAVADAAIDAAQVRGGRLCASRECAADGKQCRGSNQQRFKMHT